MRDFLKMRSPANRDEKFMKCIKKLIFMVWMIAFMISGIVKAEGDNLAAPVVVSTKTYESVMKKVQEIATECLESGAKTEFEIALWMHDWLIENADYDENMVEHGADGVLLKGKGVCESYTEAYHYLLTYMSIENKVVEAPNMNHSWNLVKINGAWTNVDCTWDDPIGGYNENHNYFGLSDEEMAADHQWDRKFYPEAQEIVWDNYDLNNTIPYPLMEGSPGINYTLIDAAGNVLLRNNFRNGNTLLVFVNRISSTLRFINAIKSQKEKLDKNNVHIIVVFKEKQQVAQYSPQIPFLCAYEADGGLESINYKFHFRMPALYDDPLLVLQNPQGYAFYHTFQFIYEPERILATAMQKLPTTQEVTSNPVYIYRTQTELEQVVMSCLKNRVEELKLCNPNNAIFDSADRKKVEDLLKQYSDKYGYDTKDSEIYTCALDITLYYRIDSGHVHYWDEWKTIEEATVKTPAKQMKTCRICHETKSRKHGKKLKAKMKLTASSVTMQTGQSAKVTIVKKMAKGDYVVSWKSSDTGILKVSGKANGTCRLIAQKRTGRARVTIRLYSGMKKVLDVRVQKALVKTKSIKGIPSKKELKKGEKWKLKPVLNPVTSQQKIIFHSSDKKLASVNAKGIVTAKKEGTVKITVKSGKKKVVCKVKIE